MKTMILILVVAYLTVGCSSEPVKEQSKPVPVIESPRVAHPAPAAKAEPKVIAKPAAKPRIAADPLNDPTSLLSKRSIYYEFDRSDIKDQYKPLIQAHAGYLTARRGAKVKIEGNCDERGSREYNLALGQRRADSVKTALKLLGVTDGQIDTVSWGEEKPKALSHDERAWAENRRSDIVYEKTR